MKRWISCGVLLPALIGAGTVRTCLGASADEGAAEIARAILDDATPTPRRVALVRENPSLSAALIRSMTADLGPSTTSKEEYRRIPWIWRVAIAAGKRNEPGELKAIFDVSLPGPDATRLADWRAVVIGGGLINGISQAGDWPGERIEHLLQADPTLARRWRHALDLATTMADDPKVPAGTRYDALRFLGTESWDRRGAQLFRYLLPGVHPELQMGAISALADVRSESTAQALLSGLHHYSEPNRELALDALLRDDGRTLALLDAVERRHVTPQMLGDRRVAALKAHTSGAVRERAGRVLAP